MKPLITVFTIFFLTLFSSNASAQEADTAKLNSLLNDAKKLVSSEPEKARTIAFQVLDLNKDLNDEGIKTKAYTWIGRSYYFERKDSNAIEYYTKALNLAQANKFKDNEAFIHSYFGTLYNRNGSYEKALMHLKKALEAAESANNIDKVLDSKTDIASVYSTIGKYPEALSYFLQAKELAQRIGKKQKLARTLLNLSYLYLNMDRRSKEGISALLECIEISKEVKDSVGLAVAYTNLGSTYAERKENKKALNYFLLALPIHQQHGNAEGESAIYNNIGEIYFDQNDYLLALEYYTKAYELSLKMDDKQGQCIYLINISTIYSKEKKYDKAIDYLIKSRDLGMSIKAYDELQKSMLFLSEAYALKGNHKKAFEHLQEYQTLHDSVYNEKNFRIMEEMRVKYETDKKEKDLVIKEEQIKLMDAQTRANKYRLISLLVLLLLIAGVSIAIYYWQKKIITKNQKLALTEKQLMELKLQASHLEKENLNKELEYKKKESMHIALQIVSKNDFLENIKDSIITTTSNLKEKESIQVLNKLVTRIEKDISISKDRNEFYTQMEQINNSFFEKLLAKYPTLTDTEKRLAALLKLNLSSKEIAAINNISPTSVDMGRHRLRKKLNLGVDENLSQFLNNL